MSDSKNESSTGGVAGFQIPAGIKTRKNKVDEVLVLNPDLNEGHALSFLSSLNEETVGLVCENLDCGKYNDVADAMRDHAIRRVVQKRVKEVVRKKAGGGGYVLYSPNQGKRKNPKPVGEFPTKLGAKRAELSRFPPKDQGKLKRLRKEVDKLLKDPKKAAEKEKAANKKKGTYDGAKKKVIPSSKKESVEIQTLRNAVAQLVKESLFREERTGSEWDEQISRLSGKALSGDKKFQTLQKNIEKRTESVLQDAVKSIKKAVKKDVKLKDFGMKKHESGKTYTAFSATMDNVEVGPIYVYVDNGVPKIEVSDSAKAALTKCDPDNAKLFRAELVTVQERVLDRVEDLSSAVESRDKYLTKVQGEVDSFVAGLTPLQVSILKDLLVKKYRRQ